MDESKVEGIYYGYTVRGMGPHSWTDTWYLDMLGDADASSSSVLMHWVGSGVGRGARGLDFCHLGASAVR